LAWDSRLRAFVTDTYIRNCDGLEPFNIAFFAKGLTLTKHVRVVLEK
jgi:hypothetical protein